MIKIGLISDTHGQLLPEISAFISSCDEIWHAGDIGSLELLTTLRGMKPLQAVFGNIDGKDIRLETQASLVFEREDKKIFIQHIAGYPGHYEKDVLPYLHAIKPDIVVAGHSHILRVIFDQPNKWLYINPGAAGNSGFHQKITACRFDLSNRGVTGFEIFEKDRG